MAILKPLSDRRRLDERTLLNRVRFELLHLVCRGHVAITQPLKQVLVLKLL